MQKKKIIALTGPKGVGKTSIAKELEERAWEDRCVVSFADPLRRMLSRLVPIKAMKHPQLKEEPIEWLGGKSPRQLLQSLGTDWGRNMISETIWIDAMRQTIPAQPFNTVIIDDCRFENEAKMVREMDGIVIRLKRKGIEYSEEHASEMPVRNADFLIDAGNVNVAADLIEQIIHS